MLITLGLYKGYSNEFLILSMEKDNNISKPIIIRKYLNNKLNTEINIIKFEYMFNSICVLFKFSDTNELGVAYFTSNKIPVNSWRLEAWAKSTYEHTEIILNDKSNYVIVVGGVNEEHIYQKINIRFKGDFIMQDNISNEDYFLKMYKLQSYSSYSDIFLQ